MPNFTRFLPEKNSFCPNLGGQLAPLPPVSYAYDRHQNLNICSLGHASPIQKVSSKSVQNFLSNPANRQTNSFTRKHHLIIRHRGNKVISCNICLKFYFKMFIWYCCDYKNSDILLLNVHFNMLHVYPIIIDTSVQ